MNNTKNTTKLSKKKVTFHLPKKRSSPKLNPEKRKVFLSLIENIMLVVIPLLIGLGNLDVFMVFSLLLMIFRLYLIIAYRKIFDNWDFCKEMFNRLIWVTFNFIYLGYYIIEKMDPDKSSDIIKNLENLGKALILVIIIGCIGEILLIIIDIGIWVYEKFK